MAKRYVPALSQAIEIHLFRDLNRYKKFMRHRGLEPTIKSMDTCDMFTDSLIRKGEHISVIMDYFKGSDVQRHALYAHEAVHVVQNFFNAIGEDAPGKEEEAYLVQGVTMALIRMGRKLDG